MNQSEILTRVQERFGTRVLHAAEFRGQAMVTIEPATLRELLVWLRDTPELGFDMLMDLGGVDYLGYPDWEEPWRFEVAYQLYSVRLNHRFRVKVAVPEEAAEIPSVWDLWGVANWMEREVFDLFGIAFDGHPNLRRILTHDEFLGHALRKDYPITRRQPLAEPVENILCEKSEYA